MADLPERQHPTHGVWLSPTSPTIIFLTVCTYRRQPWLAVPEVDTALRRVWKTAEAWIVGRYVIMPDHLHLFCSPQDGSVSLDAWVQFWKSQATRRLRKLPIVLPQKLWQTDHWDTRLRKEDRYEEKWDYVRLNPVRHGLVDDVNDWPYQGEMNSLRWY